MKIKMIATLIVLVAISSALNASADTINVNSDYSIHYFENSKNSFDQHDTVKTSHRQIQVNFEENVGIAENNDKPANNQIELNYQSPNKQVNISETLSFNTNMINQNHVIIERTYTDNVAIPERILNSAKIRSDGKIIIDELQWNEQSFNAKQADSEKLISDESAIANTINDIDNTLSKTLSPENVPSTVIVTKQNDLSLLLFIDSINHDVTVIAHNITDQKNPTLLVLLVPLSGYILLRAEEVNLNVLRSRQFFSFCFIIIISSSMYLYNHTAEKNLKDMRRGI